VKIVDGLDVEGPVDNEGALLGVDAVVRDAILSGEEVVGRVPVAAQDRIGAQMSCQHGHQRRRTVIGQHVRTPGAGAICHREDRDLILRDARRQFRSVRL
jgi:hypothetical protein